MSTLFRSERREILALCLAFLLLFTSLAFGQGILTGSIVGTIVDETGAVVPGATITARSQETNATFVANSNEIGVFVIAKVPPGHYALTVQAARFATTRVAGVQVLVARQTQVSDIKMVVAGTTETVQVTEAPPLVETGTAQVTNTLEAKAVSDLPIGRGLDQLALFLPGVSTSGSVGRGNNNGAQFAVNGQRPRSNNFQIDGQGINDSSVTGPAVFLGNNDVVAEYQVLTHYDAAYGRNMGSQVNVITKSGTNAYHGTVFETYRGSTFDSLTNEEKNPSLISKPLSDPTRAIENYFGGTIGGPIKRDKVWFFASAYWDRFRGSPPPISSGSQVTPTPTGISQLEAAFPTSLGVAYLKKFGPASLPIGNPTFSSLVTKTVTANGISVPVEFGSISRIIPSPANIRQFTGRGDWQISSKDRLFVRYLIDDELFSDLDAFVSPGGGAAGFVIDEPSRGQQVGGDWTRQFSNTLVNQVRLNWTRLWVNFEGGSSGCTNASSLTCPTQVGFRDGKILAMGLASNAPQGRQNSYWQVQDNASKLLGRHQLKWGGEFTTQDSPNFFLPNQDGTYTFGTTSSSTATSSPAFNDFIADKPFRLTLAQGNFAVNYAEKDLAFYFQDDWRVNDKLTLNLGLRWEWFQQGMNALHDLTVAQQTGSNPFWNTGVPLNRTTFPKVPEDYNNLGPLVGFAWHAMNKTIVRGGFRLAYDTTFYNIALNTSTNAPVVNTAQITVGTDPVVPGLPSSGFTGVETRAVGLPFMPTGNVAPCGSAPICDPGYRNQVAIAPNFHSPYSEQWNLGIEREVSDLVAVEVRYLGNHSLGLYQQVNGNPAVNSLKSNGFANLIPAGVAPCTTAGTPGNVSGNSGGYIDCNRRNVLLRQNSGYSYYNGLQSSLRVRSYHGFTGTLSYTWSHNIDNASDVFSTTSAGMLAMSQNPFDPTLAERGSSNFDYRHVVGLQFVYDLPFFQSQQGFLGKVLGGWQPNIIYRYSTGQPFTPFQDKSSNLCDASGTFSTTVDACRPIMNNAAAPIGSVGQITALVGGVPTVKNLATGAVGVPLDSVHWLVNDNNAAAFFGSPFRGVGRNTLTGQPTQALNFAMQKNTKINERFTLQLRATAFNVLNHMFLGTPGNDILDVTNPQTNDFMNTNFKSSGGSNRNITENGLGRRRLEFTGKIVF